MHGSDRPVNLSRVTEMGACAFYKCKQLTGAVDLSRLAKIPDQAFSYTDIEAVTLSDELTSIGRWGFLGTKLKTIAFPETLISIGRMPSAIPISSAVRL